MRSRAGLVALKARSRQHEDHGGTLQMGFSVECPQVPPGRQIVTQRKLSTSGSNEINDGNSENEENKWNSKDDGREHWKWWRWKRIFTLERRKNNEKQCVARMRHTERTQEVRTQRKWALRAMNARRADRTDMTNEVRVWGWMREARKCLNLNLRVEICWNLTR